VLQFATIPGLSRKPIESNSSKRKTKMRIKSLLSAAAILVVLPVALGQHGTARNLQNGSLHDTWLGIVVSTNDATREITLASGGGESETFTGVLKDRVSTKAKDGSIKQLQPSDIPKGTKIIVFYEQKRTKADNGKVNGDSDEVDQHSAVMPINVPG